METITIDVPAMYADHHVTEVRRILLELPGVEAVTASSAFLAVEITFDPSKTKQASIQSALDAAGYLREIPMTLETGIAADNRAFPRHSAVVAQVADRVSFAHDVPQANLGGMSCPGLGVIKMED